MKLRSLGDQSNYYWIEMTTELTPWFEEKIYSSISIRNYLMSNEYGNFNVLSENKIERKKNLWLEKNSYAEIIECFKFLFLLQNWGNFLFFFCIFFFGFSFISKEAEKEGIIQLSTLIYLKRFYLHKQTHTDTYYNKHTKKLKKN